jgi:hypothetical protein
MGIASANITRVTSTALALIVTKPLKTTEAEGVDVVVDLVAVSLPKG